MGLKDQKQGSGVSTNGMLALPTGLSAADFYARLEMMLVPGGCTPARSSVPKLNVSMASVTIYDVAAKAGVSIKTVSRVLNREPNVKADTRDRVQAAVAALGGAQGCGGDRYSFLGSWMEISRLGIRRTPHAGFCRK